MTSISPVSQSSAVSEPEPGLVVEVDCCTPGPGWVLRIRGELDLATSPLLTCAVIRAAEGRGEVELDLGDLVFCDVVGLTAIEQAVQELAARGCRPTLRRTAALHLLLSVPGMFELAT